MDVIVVASSEDSIQEALRVLLGDRHILVPARTLPQLLNAVVERPVDVVILDEYLQNTDCASVFQQLRPLAPDITSIMLAVQPTSDMAREMRARGVYDVVSKPFDKDELVASVARALERSHLMETVAIKRRMTAHEPAPPPPAGLTPVEPPLSDRRDLLESLRKFLKAVTDVFEPQRLYSLVLDAVAEMFMVNRAALILSPDNGQKMKLVAAVGLDTTGLDAYGIASWNGIISWLRKHDQILNIDDPGVHIHTEEMLDARKELDLLQARMCVPLIAKGRLIGVLALGGKVTGRRLSDTELEFLYLLSQQIATIIENAKHHRAVFVQKERFEEILQGVTSGLMATSPDGRLIVFNKAAEQILGIKASEAIGQNIQRVGSIFADIVFRTLREEKSFCRHEVVDPATKVLLGISTSLLTDSGGKPIGAVVLFTDLSTVSVRSASDTDETWQRCALCLAQEIKNPLVAIRTFTQLFPESYADEKFRKEFSEIAIKEIDKLDGVVERLLRFSQPLDLNSEPGDIHSLLEEQIGRIKESAETQNVTLKKDFAMVNGSVPFDRSLMGEALAQILDNALEAMPSGGTLTISTGIRQRPDTRLSARNGDIPHGPVAEISISDTGVGITPEQKADLFKPFHTNKVKGMGLGLSISRRIVRAHSGDIVIADDPEQGTVVTVVLPHGAA